MYVHAFSFNQDPTVHIGGSWSRNVVDVDSVGLFKNSTSAEESTHDGSLQIIIIPKMMSAVTKSMPAVYISYTGPIMAYSRLIHTTLGSIMRHLVLCTDRSSW